MHESRGRAMEARKDAVERKYNTNNEILERLKYLQINGAIDENSVLKQEDRTLELKSSILQLEEEILQSKSQYEEQSSRIGSEIFMNELQIQYETVLAPGSGIIFESKAAPKGVLNAGEGIMKIVPQDKLLADVWVTNKDIGYIKVGQSKKYV